MTDAVKTLKDWITESNNIVFFGGAGVSTESGIPDFRSVDGLYHQQYAYPPETILSRSFYEASPEEFYRFYRAKMLCLDAQPNAAHRKLAELEAAGKLRAVITQNIDGLHQKAGSRNVLELHGSVLRNYCTRCGAFHGVEAVSETTRRAWTRMSSPGPSPPYGRRRCSSSAAPPSPSTLPPGWSTTTGAESWWSSTRPSSTAWART